MLVDSTELSLFNLILSQYIEKKVFTVFKKIFQLEVFVCFVSGNTK